MRRFMLFLLPFLLVGALIFSGCAKQVTTSVEVMNLNFADEMPALYGFTEHSTEAWIKEIEERTGGRVKVTPYYSETLIATTECYQAVVDGIADMGQSNAGYDPGRFPVIQLLSLPGYPSYDGKLASVVTWEFYKKFRPQEFDDTHILFLHNFAPMIILTRDKPIRTLEDFKGLKIRCDGTHTDIVKALGATPVTMFYYDSYDAMAKGIVDGGFFGFEAITSMQIADVAKYACMSYEFGPNNAMYVTMNLDQWDLLSSDMKQVFDEVFDKYAYIAGKAWQDMEEENYLLAKGAGFEVTSLSPEDIARGRELVVTPLQEAWVADMEAKGLPGREMLDYRHELEGKYLEEYGQTVFE